MIFYIVNSSTDKNGTLSPLSTGADSKNTHADGTATVTSFISGLLYRRDYGKKIICRAEITALQYNRSVNATLDMLREYRGLYYYQVLFSYFSNGRKQPNRVMIFISGNTSYYASNNRVESQVPTT